MDKDALKVTKRLNKELWEECIVIVHHGKDNVLVINNRNGTYKLPKVMVKPELPSLFVNKKTAEQRTEQRKRRAMKDYLAARHGIRTEPYRLNELGRESYWRIEGDSAIRKSLWYLLPGDYTTDFIMSLGLGKVKREKVYRSLNLTHPDG